MLWSFFCRLFLLALLPAVACAEPRPLIHIGTSDGYPPFYASDKSGRIKGALPEVIERVAEQMGYRVQYTQYPWQRMLYMAQQGRVDAVMPLFRTDERAEFLYFHENALGFEENRLFSAAGRQLQVTPDPVSLAPLTVGVIKGYSYGDWFDGLPLEGRVEAKHESQLIKLVVNQRVDVAIGSPAVIRYYLQLSGLPADGLRFYTPEVTREPLYLGFAKAKAGSGRLSRLFSDTLALFKQTSEYQKILVHYGLTADTGMAKHDLAE